MNDLKSEKLKTNWKYLLIVIIVTFIIGGGILVYQKWEQYQFGIEPEVKPRTEKEFVEIPLEELKEGENKIHNIVIKKIKPELLCDVKNLEELKPKFIDYMYFRGHSWGDYYELTCNIENKAKIKMIGWNWKDSGINQPINVVKFLILDEVNNIIDKQGEGDDLVEFYEDKGKVEIFHFNDKIYFFVHGGAYGTKTGNSQYFLYGINRDRNIKFIAKWWCDELRESCNPEYGIGYENSVYLKIGEEIWQFGEDDVLKNKFTADKLIIKNSEISFQ